MRSTRSFSYTAHRNLQATSVIFPYSTSECIKLPLQGKVSELKRYLRQNGGVPMAIRGGGKFCLRFSVRCTFCPCGLPLFQLRALYGKTDCEPGDQKHDKKEEKIDTSNEALMHAGWEKPLIFRGKRIDKPFIIRGGHQVYARSNTQPARIPPPPIHPEFLSFFLSSVCTSVFSFNKRQKRTRKRGEWKVKSNQRSCGPT